MIVVKVDLDNANGPAYDEHLFTMIIVNDGTGTEKFGNYGVYLGERGDNDIHKVLNYPWREGKVKNHVRKGTHVGELVLKALQDIL